MPTTQDIWGCQQCPQCQVDLNLHGSWVHNGELIPGKYSFECPECYHRYTCNVQETLNHQEGEKMKKLKEQIKVFLAQRKKYIAYNPGED
jgi:hypothetical protein